MRPFYPPHHFLGHAQGSHPLSPPLALPQEGSSAGEMHRSFFHGGQTPHLLSPHANPFFLHNCLQQLPPHPLLDSNIWNHLNTAELIRLGLRGNSEPPTLNSSLPNPEVINPTDVLLKAEPDSPSTSIQFSDVDEDKLRKMSGNHNFLSIGSLLNRSNDLKCKSFSITNLTRNDSVQSISVKSPGFLNTSIEREETIAESVPTSGKNIKYENVTDSYSVKSASPIQSPIPKYPPVVSAFSPAGRLLSLLPAQHPYQVLLRREWGDQLEATPLNIFNNKNVNDCIAAVNENHENGCSPRTRSSSRSRSVSPSINVDSSPIRENSTSPLSRNYLSFSNDITEDSTPSVFRIRNKNLNVENICSPHPNLRGRIEENSNSNECDNQIQSHLTETTHKQIKPKSLRNHYSSRNNKQLPNEQNAMDTSSYYDQSERTNSPFDSSSFPRFYFNSKCTTEEGNKKATISAKEPESSLQMPLFINSKDERNTSNVCKYQ